MDSSASASESMGAPIPPLFCTMASIPPGTLSATFENREMSKSTMVELTAGFAQMSL